MQSQKTDSNYLDYPYFDFNLFQVLLLLGFPYLFILEILIFQIHQSLNSFNQITRTSLGINSSSQDSSFTYHRDFNPYIINLAYNQAYSQDCTVAFLNTYHSSMDIPFVIPYILSLANSNYNLIRNFSDPSRDIKQRIAAKQLTNFEKFNFVVQMFVAD